ncbi:hypothetical protein D9615_010619, partial [Tricholomella constricta]
MRPIRPVAHTPRPLRPSPPLSPGPSRHSQRWSPRPSPRPSPPPPRSSPGPPPLPIVASPSLPRAAPLRHVSGTLPPFSVAVEPTRQIPAIDTPFSPTTRMSSPLSPEYSPVPGKSNLPAGPISAAPPLVNVSDASKDRLIEMYASMAARIVRQNDASAALEEQAQSRQKDLEKAQHQIDHWKDIALQERNLRHAVLAREGTILDLVTKSSALVRQTLGKASQTKLHRSSIRRPTTETSSTPSSGVSAREKVQENEIRHRRRDMDEEVMDAGQAGAGQQVRGRQVRGRQAVETETPAGGPVTPIQADGDIDMDAGQAGAGQAHHPLSSPRPQAVAVGAVETETPQ